ncbi:hypothetical protein VKT23_007845 [Stygiomarasmius scandens]|uniref:Uncharacterized protein n=1 Tax=Marasmiellus scandens TaxID=2682957 RepID=A0ABR1JJQ8_9AGAR
MGGFTDEDVFTDRPSPEDFTQYKSTGGNNMVSVALAAPRKPKAKAKPAPLQHHGAVADVTASFPAHAPVHARQVQGAVPAYAPAQTYVLAQAYNPAPYPAPAVDTASKIPNWVEEKWDSAILPTLYHLLYTSKSPFSDFSKEGTAALLVGQVQRALDAVFPGHTLVVESDDAISGKASAHLTEKRGAIGSLTLKLVQSYIAKHVADDPAAIRAFCSWALPHGLALYRVPINPQHPDPRDPLFVTPEDPYKSAFVIDTMTTLLAASKKLALNSKDLGYPLGALALVATGIERAIVAHSTSVYVNPGPFSRDKLSKIVDQYVTNVSQLSDRRWASILKNCSAEQTLKDARHEPLKTAAIMDMHRINLYIPSPVKGKN